MTRNTHLPTVRRLIKIRLPWWGVEAPAWHEATRARTGLYTTEERQSQAGWIGGPVDKVVLINRLSLAVGLAAVALGLATWGCKPKKMSQAQICEKGCAYRLACIEELALDKAVTDANRAITRQRQQKDHDGFLKFCVDACKQGKRRLRGYAACGVKVKTCADFFECAKQVEQASK